MSKTLVIISVIEILGRSSIQLNSFVKHLYFLFQRNCIEFALNAKPIRRYIPKNPIQYKLWAFVTSPVFEYTIFSMILINTLSLAMKFYNQPDVYTEFLNVLNIIFTVFFTLEFVFKLGAFRFKVRLIYPFILLA